jgi:hypothetical protein
LASAEKKLEDVMTIFTLRILFAIAAVSLFAELSHAQICVTSDGNNNTACGTSALPSPSPAQGAISNSAFGAESLYSDTTGAQNTALGFQTLYYNTTGNSNVAVGNGALYFNTIGNNETAVGSAALLSNVSGEYNTAVGSMAMAASTAGSWNTAIGYAALQYNTQGFYNTATGYFALQQNMYGFYNTAAGVRALELNSSGMANTADGYTALTSNTVGNYNSGFGYGALLLNTTGSYMTAVGAYALGDNSTGESNAAFGAYALPANTAGNGNTAFGFAGLRSNTTGNNNIGFGVQSLYQNATGSNNIAMGYQAAYNVTNGSNTIEIGSVGAAGDKDMIRLGTQGTQIETLIAGIYGSTVTGSAVYVTSGGKLGVLASSERYKTAIAPMGESTEKLLQLRPVSFHLKSDPSGPVQYGLIAEEVAKVFPELVIRDDTGAIQGVRYEELAPMLLNEMQQDHKAMSDKIAAQAAELNDLKQEVHAALRQLKSMESLTARQ